MHIILDRDGVINKDSDAYIKSPDEWFALPGCLAAIARFTQAGWKIAVATNQSGIGRGMYSEEILKAIHEKLLQAVAREGGVIDFIVFCPHIPQDDCECRKPKPGLVRKIKQYWGISLEGVPFVGDSIRDLQAGVALGCQPILVETGKGISARHQLADYPALSHTLCYADLSAVADALLPKS